MFVSYRQGHVLFSCIIRTCTMGIIHFVPQGATEAVFSSQANETKKQQNHEQITKSTALNNHQIRIGIKWLIMAN